MTDNQVGYICAALVLIAWLGLLALCEWIEYKTELIRKRNEHNQVLRPTSSRRTT